MGIKLIEKVHDTFLTEPGRTDNHMLAVIGRMPAVLSADIFAL